MLTAAWPATHTVPGMARPAAATQHPPRGGDLGEGMGAQEGTPGHLLPPLRRSRRQDVRHGNPMRQCRGYNSNGEWAWHDPREGRGMGQDLGKHEW